MISASKKDANFVICFPSTILRPLPLISYMLAEQSGKSVLVFSKNNVHYKNYYLLKIKYPRNFVYIKYPAAKIKKTSLNIDLYAPHAKRSYKEEYKKRIPSFKEKFFDEETPKILFYQKSNIRFSDSIKNLTFNNVEIGASERKKSLRIGNVVFENLDYFIYNANKLKIFQQWIEEFREKDMRFLFHISNPSFRLLEEFKLYFNAYVLYFPFTFIKSNEDLKIKNKEYFSAKNVQAYDNINLDNNSTYQIANSEKINILKNLKRGNIDKFFNRGIRLFKQIKWDEFHDHLPPIVFQLRNLFFKVYKMFCIPSEFNVKYLNEEEQWRHIHLERFLNNSLREVRKHSHGSNKANLQAIITYLAKIVNELSECKRYKEPKSYRRLGKSSVLCKYIEENPEKKFYIGVQSGEKKLIHEMVESLDIDYPVRILTLRQLTRRISDFSDSTLLLAGQLLPSYLPVLFKNWKEIQYFVYKGKNHKLVKKQLELINHVDISKEELSLKYLAEIYKDLIGVSDYSLQKDKLFKRFLEKKKKLIQPQNNVNIKKADLLKEELPITTASLTDLCKQIMKDDIRYKELIDEEKSYSIVKRYKNKNKEIYKSKIKEFDCRVVLKNEITGNILITEFDVHKKYMYFSSKDNIKIEMGFPHSLKKDLYVVLFGEEEKQSITDFIKESFEFEEDFDNEIITKWQERLADYYLKNFSNYNKFHRRFTEETKSTISSAQFNNWVKGRTTYTKDALNLYYLGEFMKDSFFIENYKTIQEEGLKRQTFNIKLSRKLKKLITQILDGNIIRKECSPYELLLLEKMENSIFKINEISIKKENQSETQ